jgi:tetratricopeptide (TPR) repeat protein
MNPDDDKHDDPKDEERIASVLATSETDAAPPDPEVLAKLRAQSTDAFAAAQTAKRSMFYRRARWLGAAAAAIVIGVALYSWFAPSASAVTLGQVLDNLDKADTVHLRFSRDNEQFEFWHTSEPNRSRWNHPDGTYRVADGKTYWIVNEKANEARRANSPMVKTADELLNLLWISRGPEDRAKVFAALPVSRDREGDIDLDVYRTEVFVLKAQKLQIEARVFVQNGRLHSIRTRLEEFGRFQPHAELTVVAYDEPISADKFAIADTLTEDGRIGKVADVQGIVTIKPVLHERWTPVRDGVVLRPGDWVRTDARGANAVALRLVRQTGIILGPKALVELIGPKQIRLIEGEIEITPTAGASVELLGPEPPQPPLAKGGNKNAPPLNKGGQGGVVVKGKKLFHIDAMWNPPPWHGKEPGPPRDGPMLVELKNEPSWLRGFKGSTTNETLGSLVALVDGRNVPLTVGYHKVTVDIRDQIARTVIEESFVNHTNAQLEGVFHFPLPADASISGFGMWIGDNLVEADVVEKQRAREIYETILRERRDPGLLEWSGGNIFKARVFPIAANSEKRIKIVYTQVLPLKGSRYRYSYALQSELLQQHPLRELNIDVKVNSVTALKSVTSPTHPTRDERTPHSAHVEFTAQEYTPTRDFEVVIETEGRQADVVMIPHRRGDDGYFMLQLTPPTPPSPPLVRGGEGGWDRPILANGDPVNLLILADTSASIDAGQRATQATFIGSLLSALTSKDTFNLATSDVTTDWAFAKASIADTKNVSAARDFLANRTSLGWTDLDGAFASALKQAGPKTHVIYVGDGIVTNDDADPVAFTKRLRRLVQGKGATFHAVTLGSSFEAAVVKAIASLGSGSMRKISTEQGPTTVARELLGEIAQPALRDIKVEFKGMKVARVYPDSLANIPAGSQQILLGRYLPEGKDQAGEVIVTGTQGGKPVRFSTRASLKDAEQGNSFIPRLWARMHLDSLLEQGSSDTIKDEIISLSEEFQIITPYTSLLVLETDADRERFKVKRRFQMRDGERFFADGRDNAVFDLAQKQMKKAGNWRTALRRSVLSELARLGREPRVFQRRSPFLQTWGGDFSIRNSSFDFVDDGVVFLGGLAGQAADSRTGSLMLRKELALGIDVDGLEDFRQKDSAAFVDDLSQLVDKQQTEWKGERMLEPLGVDSPVPYGKSEGEVEYFFRDENEFQGEFFPPAYGMLARGPSRIHTSITGGILGQKRGELYDGDESLELGEPAYFLSSRGKYRIKGASYYGNSLNTLFPPLAWAPGEPSEPKSTWPATARELAKSLLRTGSLAKMTGGIEIFRQTDTFDARWGDLSGRSRRLERVAAKSWLTRSASDGGQTLVSWCDAKEIGIYSKAYQLGRVRASTPLDVQPPPLEMNDHSLASLEQTYFAYTATLEPEGKDRTWLVLKQESSPLYQTRMLIDTARHVVLRIENRFKDKVTGVTKFDDFVEVAGSWWPQRVETTNEDGKRLSLVTQTVKSMTLNELDKQTKIELAGRDAVQFLHLPMPTIASAKKALSVGKANIDDHFVLLLHFHRSQQWPRVLEHLAQIEKLAAGKPGLRWVRSALLYDSRRHEELRKRYNEDAARLAKVEPADPYYLAEYIVGQSGQVLQANEMLTLLDTLKPLYDKQPVHVGARKNWEQMRVARIAQTGRTDEEMRLRKQLAADYPRDYSLQQTYAQGLANTGDYPAAYAWLTRVLVKEAKWLDWETESLRSAYANLLEQQGRYADLVTYLAAWVEQNPDGRSAYERYLSALIKADQIEKADALALAWLKAGQVPGELSPAADARLSAAVYFMLGNAYQLNTNRVEERWLTPLAEAALSFARNEARASLADQILSNYQFRRTEEAQRVRKTLAGVLSAEIDKLPVEEVRRLIGWVQADDIEPAGWKKIGDALRQRWTDEAKDDVKHLLGQALVTVLSSHGGSSEPLAFLRLQWKTGPEKHRAEYANQLFDQLLTPPIPPLPSGGKGGLDELESEAFAMLDKLSTAEAPGARLYVSVAALHRLTGRLVENRITTATKILEHLEKLTRTELHKKQDEIRKSAREGVADRLHKEAAKHPKALGQWLVAESLYLDMLLDRNLKQVAAEAWEFVGAAPPKAVTEPSIERGLEEMLRQRYFITLMNLAARKGAEAALVERLVKYIDQGIADNADGETWKYTKYRVLIALDRAKDLEQTLRQWTQQDDPDNQWRIALGYLLAEQGRLPEAIREFEAVEAADELTPSAYRSLAEWYLVQNQRELHERAAAAVYKTTPERQLSQMIAHKLNPWQQREGHLPTELDKEVLRMFAVLFEKSNTPQHYLYQLQQFYQASHDFRLLAGLPDAVIGHSAARVYPFVAGMQSVLTEVRDEATADEIVKRIAEVRPRAKTDVDKRALDMLEVLVERRAAEVLNQPGPHQAKALAALVRASKGQWSPGEPRLMADFLAGLGRITQSALADEQKRQLKSLQGEAAPGSLDRLHIAYQYAVTLHNYDGATGIDVLQAALDEFQAANDGVLPVTANNALTTFVGFLDSAGHFARGERVLVEQLKHPVHAQQRRWLIESLHRLYWHALTRDGDVSLGKGNTLYKALNAKMQKDLDDTDQNHRYQLIYQLCQVYRTAHEKKLPDVGADVKAFAFQVGPPLLKQLTNHHESVVSTIAQTVRDVVGPRDGIVFLLDEIDTQPRWLRYNNQDGWSRHGSTLAQWRIEAKELGDVEGRLLKLVLAELRRDLETRESRNRTIYHHGHDRFWKEKTPDFAKTAEAVLAERNKSGPAVVYIADYLYWGLGKTKRAIEILFVAYGQKLLDEEGQGKLIDFLHRENRHGESIAVLQPLIERRPENLEYRVLLMHAYFRTDRKAELLALLKQSDTFFHEKGRWGEHAMSRLAKSTLQNELFEQSVAYAKELIPLHERTQPNRGIGNGTLAAYYTDLAKAYAGLKKTPEAVDAASGAIVAWGPRHQNRATALGTLKDVLWHSPDLDAFVVHFDQQKQDSAIIRKAIGQAYHEMKEYGKAIKQLEQAAALQPNDAETYQLMIASHDKLDDKQGAIRQLLQAVQMSRRDLKLYEELGKRYAAEGQTKEAERAYTSIVEMSPTESESHALLAEVREKQDRWSEAIHHWEQVVRIRALEPTGLLKLAAAQIHQKQWEQARETLRKVDVRNWPQRFGDVRQEVRKLEERLAKQQNK